MSWMNIIHKAKTQSGQMITGADRLAPSELITGKLSNVVPQIDPQREREMRSKENLKANLDARMKQVNAEIKSKQLEIDNETRGQNNQLKLNRLGKDMNILREKATKIKQQVMMDSGKKQRQAAGLSNNVKQILQNQGTKTPVQSVKDVELPVRSVALPSVQGTTPTQDPLVGFAQERGLMPQTTQNVPKPTQNVELPNVPQQTQQEVTQEATQQASQPTPQQGQRTGPPPKKRTTAQLNQEAQQRKVTEEATQAASQPSQNTQEPVNDQNKKLYGEKYLEELRRFNAVSPKQQKKNAKAQAKQQKQQAKQQARQQKTQQRLAQQQQRQQEKEAKRQAKQNPRAGGQLVRRNPNPMNNPNSRLVPKGQAPPPKSRLIPRKPMAIPIAKSDELSKSIKNILRR
jgi:hypothetical protein